LKTKQKCGITEERRKRKKIAYLFVCVFVRDKLTLTLFLRTTDVFSLWQLRFSGGFVVWRFYKQTNKQKSMAGATVVAVRHQT